MLDILIVQHSLHTHLVKYINIIIIVMMIYPKSRRVYLDRYIHYDENETQGNL